MGKYVIQSKRIIHISIMINLLLIMVCLLSSCGSGATSGDPLATDSVTVTATSTSISSGQSCIITATVKHADGRAATGRTVSFSFAANDSGGTLTVSDNGMNNGIATAIYTAGWGATTSKFRDIVVAKIENGAGASVVFNGSIVPGGVTLALSASRSTVSGTQISLITANVTDGNNVPLGGVTVTFSLLLRGSGTPALSSTSVVTDGGGKAVTVYSPGLGSPTDTVDDAIEATLANGSSQIVILTRSNLASAANTVSLASSCSTNTPNVAPSNSCVITATVKNPFGSVVSGIPVTFAIMASGTGAPLLTPAAGTAITTDGNGNASTTYTAGAIAGKTDAITATITGGEAAIILTD